MLKEITNFVPSLSEESSHQTYMGFIQMASQNFANRLGKHIRLPNNLWQDAGPVRAWKPRLLGSSHAHLPSWPKKYPIAQVARASDFLYRSQKKTQKKPHNKKRNLQIPLRCWKPSHKLCGADICMT